MKPSCDTILQNVASMLGTKYLPMLQADMDKKQLGLLAMLQLFVAEEFDRAASRRIEENRKLRDLFSKAISVVQDGELKKKLTEAAASEETDFRVSALDKVNGDMLSLLIDLHSHVETLNGADARQLDDAIWHELEDGTKRRESAIWELAISLIMSREQDQ